MSETREGVFLLPLLYFQTTRTFYITRGRFDLKNGVTIRKINATEIREIQKKRGSEEYPLDRSDVETINYTLEKKMDLKEPLMEVDLSEIFNKVIAQFKNVVLSMRLFKQGTVGYKAAFFLVEEQPYIIQKFKAEPSSPSIVPIYKMLKEKTPIFARYTLSEIELTEFDLFCQEVITIVNEREEKWPLSIRYFSRMYESKPYQDVLVDCIISFEALVFRGEKKTSEKKMPLALAISMLIGKNFKEREKIKATLKEAYDVRNCIVHGNPPQKSPIEIATLCWETEEYLRRSIRKLHFEEEQSPKT